MNGENEDNQSGVWVRLRRLRRPRFLIVVLVATLVTGVATALFESKVGIGVVAALVMFIVVLQFELSLAFSDTDDKARAKLRELAPIVEVHQQDSATSQFLQRLASAQIRYLKSRRKLEAFRHELAHERDALLHRYEECAQGSMRVDLRPSSILSETDAASMLTQDLVATSLVDACSYWDAPFGIEYLRQQEVKLKGGAKIRRVFIQQRDSLADLRNVVNQHLAWKASGLDADCRIAVISELSPDLIADYAVVDLETVIRSEIPRGMGVPRAVMWETDPGIVEREMRSFENLWHLSAEPHTFAELT